MTATTIAAPVAVGGMNYRKAFTLLTIYVILLAAVTVILFPVFWMMSSSLKPQTELFARDLTLLPIDWTLENYRNVWLQTDFPLYFWNSFKVAALSTFFAVIVSMYAAYAIARIRFRGRQSFGLLLLVTLVWFLRNIGKKKARKPAGDTAHANGSPGETGPAGFQLLEQKLVQLERLSRLKDQGALTEDEFQRHKQQVLGNAG